MSTLDAFAVPEPGGTADITFTIRQHGVTPVDVDGAAIVIEDGDGSPDRFLARSAGSVGRYVATVTFPTKGGQYPWSVDQGWFEPQALGLLAVGGGPAPAAPAEVPRWPLAVRLVLPALAGALGLLAVLEVRRPPRPRRQPIPA